MGQVSEWSVHQQASIQVSGSRLIRYILTAGRISSPSLTLMTSHSDFRFERRSPIVPSSGCGGRLALRGKLNRRMQQPQIAPYPVSDFLQWEGLKQLSLTPKFQRRDVWTPKAKSYLIDSIIRNMPIPPIFLRLSVDAKQKKVVREVIDGQQRLRAVLAFMAGDFTISRVHNKDFGDIPYENLPDNVKSDFLSYKFQVNTLENVSDAEVLRIFARLNTYTTPLKGQELINAEFFGAFKERVYEIALQHYTFWTANNIFSDAKIARMAEAEFTSELIVTMLDGFRQTKLGDLRTYYVKFDDDFPAGDRIQKRFQEVVDLIGEGFRAVSRSGSAHTLRNSPFRRTPLFFSLFMATYGALFGMEGSERSARSPFPRNDYQARLRQLLDDLASISKPRDVVELLELSAKATADVSRRRERHRILTDRLFS